MKLENPINFEVVRKLREAYFVGRLVYEDELAATLIEEPVKIDEHNGHTQFYIKCLSEIPESITQHFVYSNKIMTGTTGSPNNEQKLDALFDRPLTFPEKKDKITEALKDKLIIFQISPTKTFCYIEIVKIENIAPESNAYSVIPGLEISLGETRSDIEGKLITGRPIVLPDYPHILSTPEFVIHDDVLYQVALKTSQNPTTYLHDHNEAIKYLDLSETLPDYVVARVDDKLYVVDKETSFNLVDQMNDEGINLNVELEQREAAREVSATTVITAPSHETQEETEEESPDIDLKHHKSEMAFLRTLKENARKRGLYYEDIDLYTFHVSVKTDLLTILGGLSGTGKSQLAYLYGETLGLEDNRELLMIPISPSYHEPNDILGYLNPNTGVYHESETGLVSLLQAAEQQSDRLFMCIFDEANLSQVEHWFSPFISLLERDDTNRHLKLFSHSSHCVNGYRPEINVLDNIIFTGTVNFDETTKSFSDRLLDRANLIMPHKMTFAQSRNMPYTIGNMTPCSVSKQDFRNQWVQSDVGLTFLTEREAQILDRIHQNLCNHDPQKGVSFRVALGIVNFLANIPLDEQGKPLIPRSVAFDIQVKQRILTKIKGLESFVGPLVGYLTDDGHYEDGIVTQLLRSPEAQQVSSFTQSIAMLKSKAKELMYNGFAN